MMMAHIPLLKTLNLIKAFYLNIKRPSHDGLFFVLLI